MSQYITVRSKTAGPDSELLFAGELLKKRRTHHRAIGGASCDVNEWVLSGYFLLGDGTWSQNKATIMEPDPEHFMVVEITKKEFFVMLLKEGLRV